MGLIAFGLHMPNWCVLNNLFSSLVCILCRGPLVIAVSFPTAFECLHLKQLIAA